MGCEELVDTSTPQKELYEVFEELCPYALSIGMTLQEYWEEDLHLFDYYVKAEEIRQKKLNTQLWLQGLYVYQAIGNLSPVLNGFSKEHKARPYLKEPIALTKEEEIERENNKILKFKQQLISYCKGG